MSNRRILIVGGGANITFHPDYLLGLAAGELGHIPHYFNNARHRRLKVGHYKIGEKLLSKKGFWYNQLTRFFKRKVAVCLPDIVIVVAPGFLDPSAVDFVRKEYSTRVVLWMHDDPYQFETTAKPLAPVCDYVFTNSPVALPMYKALVTQNVQYMPMACSPEVHRPVMLNPKDRRRYGSSISYIGKYDSKRIPDLTIACEFQNFNLWGKNWNRLPMESPLRERWMGELDFDEFAKVYSATQIGLNVQSSRKTNAYSATRPFEVTGCGALLLSQNISWLDHDFQPDVEAVFYSTEEELRDKANYYLLQDSEAGHKIACKGRERAYRDHTYTRRLETILGAVGL